MRRNSINVYKRPNESGIIQNFSTILLFGLICLCKQIKAGEGSVRMSLHTRRWHVPARNHEPSWGKRRFAISLHQSLSQFGQRNYRNMLVPCHDTMPSFMIFRCVLELQELKNQVSQSFRPSHDAQMFEFHSNILHGTYKFTQKTHMWFFNQLWCIGACACSSNLNYAHKMPTKPS